MIPNMLNPIGLVKSGATVKGLVMNLESGVPYSFLFNPTTLKYGRTATYSEISAPGSSYPITQYVKGDSRVFSLELFLHDNPYNGKINIAEEYFKELLPPENNKDRYKKPPMFLFSYGGFIRKCVLEGMDVKLERFNRLGLPIQARITLSIRQVGV